MRVRRGIAAPGAAQSVADGGPQPDLTIRLFGAFDLRVSGESPPALPRKAQWLLALLALREGREVERAWLAGTLWPESEESQALYNLRRELARLRDALGPHASRLRSPGARTLSLQASAAEVDALAFDASAATAGVAELKRAVALHRGPLLEGCTEEWVASERARREQAYLRALAGLAAQATATGEPAAAACWLRMLLAADPFRESAWRDLLSALAASGDSAAVVQAYRDLRLLLRRELSTDTDPQTDALYAALRRAARERLVTGASQPRPAAAPRSARLPSPLTRLIGRAAETEAILAALASSRLVTLTGAGGIGKTRLAIHAAERFAAEVDDGVWFIDLSTLGDPALVIPTAASALGVREQPGRALTDTLVESLCQRRALLLLDNCEHLIEPCAALVATLIGACGDLAILATSRQPLGITGEYAFRVPSLALPDPAAAPMSPCASIELFLERARQARPGFEPPSELIDPAGVAPRDQASPIAIIAQICRQLDGIPLAIELAAARVRVLPVAEIASRLDRCFRLLVGGSRAALPRQKTLRATMDWSHDLLTPDEQVMLRRLAVFASGFTLSSAEAVGAGDGLPPDSVLPLISQLVEKSLVVAEPSARARFRLLETVRQYAWERLELSGEQERVRERHLAHFVAFAEEAEPFIFGGASDKAWIDSLEAEIDNLRAACDWSGSSASGAEANLRLVAALHWFWFASGRLREGRERTALALARGADAAPLVRSRALVASSFIAVWQGEATSMAAPREALSILGASGDRWSIAYALCVLGAAATSLGDLRTAREVLDESIRLARHQGRRVLVPFVLWWLGLVAQAQGDASVARASLEEGLALAREERWAPAIAHLGYMLGRLELALGNHGPAVPLYAESLALLHRLGDRWGMAITLDGFARLAVLEQQPERAARLEGASTALREAIGAALSLPDRPESDGAIDLARSTLGSECFRRLHAEGRAMSLDQAVACALWRDTVHSKAGSR
jgi:non-specific serine/threonine protein kinase